MKDFLEAVVQSAPFDRIEFAPSFFDEAVRLGVLKPHEIGSFLRLRRMPQLVRIRFPAQTPSQRTGVEVMGLDFLDEHRPLQLPDGHDDPDVFQILLKDRGELFGKERSGGNEKFETERNAVSVQNAVAVVILPASFLKKRSGSIGVVGNGDDGFVVLGAVDVKGAAHHGPQAEEKPLQNHLPVQEHGHGSAHPSVVEIGFSLIPADIRVAGKVVFELSKTFLKPGAAGLFHPLDGPKTHEIQAAFFQHVQGDRIVRNDLEDDPFDVRLRPPVSFVSFQKDFFSRVPAHKPVGAGTQRASADEVLIEIVSLFEEMGRDDRDASAEFQSPEVRHAIPIPEGVVVQDFQLFNISVVVAEVGRIHGRVVDPLERIKHVPGRKGCAVLPMDVFSEMKRIVQTVFGDFPSFGQNGDEFQGLGVSPEKGFINVVVHPAGIGVRGRDGIERSRFGPEVHDEPIPVHGFGSRGVFRPRGPKPKDDEGEKEGPVKSPRLRAIFHSASVFRTTSQDLSRWGSPCRIPGTMGAVSPTKAWVPDSPTQESLAPGASPPAWTGDFLLDHQWIAAKPPTRSTANATESRFSERLTNSPMGSPKK